MRNWNHAYLSPRREPQFRLEPTYEELERDAINAYEAKRG